MTYKDWTKEELETEIFRLERTLEAAKVLMQVDEIEPTGANLSAIIKAQVTLDELRKEYKRRL